MKRILFGLCLLALLSAPALAGNVTVHWSAGSKAAEIKPLDMKDFPGDPVAKPGVLIDYALFLNPAKDMEFVWVSGGCFRMGSSGGDADERPEHEVCLDGFWLGKYEVTSAQFSRYKAMLSLEASLDAGIYTLETKEENRHPVGNVSWEEAKAYISWLSSKGYGRYRLPTEAEWEYAARAGSRTKRYWGDDDAVACQYANVADQAAKRQWKHWTVFFCDDKYSGSAPVGSYKPNAWGLYDMLGNVWEWCEDVYSSTGYTHRLQKNQADAGPGKYRVLRGGGWASRPDYVRSTVRDRDRPNDAYGDTGFRLVKIQ